MTKLWEKAIIDLRIKTSIVLKFHRSHIYKAQLNMFVKIFNFSYSDERAKKDLLLTAEV